MTGRVVDSYTNIATVKLFSHAGREETYAKEGMDEFLQTVHQQMRKVTMFHIAVYINNCVALAVISGLSIWFWLNGGSPSAPSPSPSVSPCASTACRSGSCGKSRRCSRTSARSMTAWR
jgi:ABC-type multidrug transport system fused ATPase/permease subunit